MPVHVSLHDVTPRWRSEIEEALALCEAAGVKPALLVVPRYHGEAPIDGDDRWCGRLRELQARGSEVYLHGLLHRSDTKAGTLSRIYTQRVISDGEAEMSNICPDEARRRLDEGERILKAAGLRIDGFVPPAWSMHGWLLQILASRGYRFTEDHLRVYDPSSGRARYSLLFNWATRSPMRLCSTVAWCRSVRRAGAFIPARIAIHPGDMRFLLLRREIARLLAWASGDFVARGGELLSAGRVK